MTEEAYRRGISETLEILKYSGKEYTEKIPKKLMTFLQENRSKEYNPQLDFSKQIEEMNLLPETKGLLSILYMDYWSTPEEKEEFKNILKTNQEIVDKEIREKYDPNKIFATATTQSTSSTSEINKSDISNNSNNLETTENTDLVPYKENFMKNLIEKIKQFINKILKKQ